VAGNAYRGREAISAEPEKYFAPGLELWSRDMFGAVDTALLMLDWLWPDRDGTQINMVGHRQRGASEDGY